MKVWTQDLIEQTSKKSGLTKNQTRKAISAFVEAMADTILAEQQLGLKNIGTIGFVDKISMFDSHAFSIRRVEYHASQKLKDEFGLPSDGLIIKPVDVD